MSADKAGTRGVPASEQPARPAHSVNVIMERAEAALHRNAWFEAERLAQRGLELARQGRDFGLMARISLPLQEARRQRLQLACDAGPVRIVDQPFGEDVRVEPGCILIRPPLVGADSRRLRLVALEQEIPAAVLCREPETRLRMCPIVAIGQVTIRTKVDPPSDPERPSLAWFVSALEALGDAAIETLDREVDPIRQVDAILARLDAMPDHEKLHQALADACRSAAREIAAGRLPASELRVDELETEEPEEAAEEGDEAAAEEE